MRKRLWLDAPDLLVWNVQESLVMMFHLHGAIWWSKNMKEILDHNRQFIVPVLHIVPDLWAMPEEVKISDALDYVTIHSRKKLEKAIKFFSADKKMFLHANSAGGPLALKFAQEYAQDISTIILTSSSGNGENLSNKFWEVFQFFWRITKKNVLVEQQEEMKDIISSLINMDPRSIKEYMIQDALDLGFVYNETKGYYHATDKAQIMKFRELLHVLAKTEKQVFRDLIKALYTMGIKFQFIWWENDTITSPEIIRDQAHILGQEAVIIADVWHSAFMENPTSRIQAVNDWPLSDLDN